MKSFYAGFEKKANLLMAAGRGLLGAGKTVVKHPMKSMMGGFLATDMASAASKASRQSKINKMQWAGPYRY